MTPLKKSLLAVAILAICTGIAACGQKPTPQPSCNFVQNSDGQRVSWGDNVPVVLYVDSSVPGMYFDSIQAAADQWNKSVGKEVLRIGGWTNSAAGPAQDGANIIYWQNTWDESVPYEQARTTVYWSGNRLTEADVLINAQNFRMSYGQSGQPGEVDMQSLVLHEFGHVLGLVHVTESESVMVKTLPEDYLRRVPAPYDLNSVSCEY